MNTREFLESRKRDLLEKLRSLDQPSVSELEDVLRALAALDPDTSPIHDLEFAGLDILDAAYLYLDRRGNQPISEQELINALVSKGVARGKGRSAAWRIRQSFAFHVDNHRLIRESGMISLPPSVARKK